MLVLSGYQITQDKLLHIWAQGLKFLRSFPDQFLLFVHALSSSSTSRRAADQLQTGGGQLARRVAVYFASR